MHQRKPFDIDSYIHQIQNSPCFICEMVSGRVNGNYVIYQDNRTIAFLNKFPVLYGYVLVAPVDHKEQIVGDFTMDEYVDLQRDVYRVAKAVERSVETERTYILSLGSQQGNRHIHWHIAPLPHGVPFKEQQLEALRAENGILDIPESEMEGLASRIRENMEDREQAYGDTAR